MVFDTIAPDPIRVASDENSNVSWDASMPVPIKFPNSSKEICVEASIEPSPDKTELWVNTIFAFELRFPRPESSPD